MPPETRKKSFKEKHGTVLRCMCGLMTGIIVFVGIAVFITWLSVQPQKPKYSLDSGSILHFNISDAGLVTATAKFNVTTRNPNKKMGIYYDRIGTALTYDDQEIAWGSHLPFYQIHKNTTVLESSLSGDSVSVRGDSGRDLKLEHSSGHVDMEFHVYASVRFKVGGWKSGHHTLRVTCSPVTLDVAGRSFQPVESCEVEV